MSEVSVIVPAYKAEKTLEAAVRSLQAQTLSGIEIWIVDDGSPDRTGEIADRLAGQDGRIHVIHQENGGSYSARLAALRRITTPYFGFVDADDSVEPEMYEKMLLEAKRTNADVVQCGTSGSLVSGMQFLSTREEVLREYVIPSLVEGRGASLLWDKLYRNKGVPEDPLDGRLIIYEDLLMNMQLFRKVESIAFLGEKYYRYTPNEGSVTCNFRDEVLDNLSRVVTERKRLVHWFGVDEDDVVMDKWVVSNMVTWFKKALKAKGSSPMKRLKNAFSVLMKKELRHALWRRATKCLRRKRKGCGGTKVRGF